MAGAEPWGPAADAGSPHREPRPPFLWALRRWGSLPFGALVGLHLSRLTTSNPARLCAGKAAAPFDVASAIVLAPLVETLAIAIVFRAVHVLRLPAKEAVFVVVVAALAFWQHGSDIRAVIVTAFFVYDCYIFILFHRRGYGLSFTFAVCAALHALYNAGVHLLGPLVHYARCGAWPVP